MRCPVCGSERLAWRDDVGYLVCQDCGAVIEQLIEDEGPLRGDEESPPRRRRPRPLSDEGAPPAGPTLEDAVEELVEKAVRRGKVIKVVGRTVRLASPATKAADDPQVEEALKVMRSYPPLYFRTERVRLGIAYYALIRALGASRLRAIAEASARSGASAKSIERALRAYRALADAYESEVRAALAAKIT